MRSNRSHLAPLRLQLLGRFALVRSDGVPLELPRQCERLLAFLALDGRSVGRSVVAGHLWPDTSEPHSNGSLRSALWRLASRLPSAIDVSGHSLALSDAVTIDIDELTAVASRLRAGHLPDELPALIHPFEQDLLPDWDEEWIVISREHWRHVRLHALETVAALLRSRGEFAAATDAALAVLEADPLRETAHESLLATYLAEGNRPEALRQFAAYTMVLKEELGLAPAPRLAALVGLSGQPRPPRHAAATSGERHRGPSGPPLLAASRR
jgi:DNA-binding SARP family transcriptional activator